MDIGTAMVISGALSALFGGRGGGGDIPGWLQDWIKKIIKQSYGPGGVSEAIQLGGRMAAGMPLSYQTLAGELSRRPWDSAANAGAFAAAADAARRYGEAATRGIGASIASRFGTGASSYGEGQQAFLSQLVSDAITREAFAQRERWLENLAQLFQLQNQYIKQWMPSHVGIR